MWRGKLGIARRTNQLPIPDCTETSVWERMRPEDRQPMAPPQTRLPEPPDMRVAISPRMPIKTPAIRTA